MKKLDFFKPIKEVLPVDKDYKGEVGIEIEVEGANLLKEVPSYWQINPEHSLRGESAEYVLRQPCQRDSTIKFLKYLKDRLDRQASVINESVRTSVHIHVNVNTWTFVECFNYIVLYLIFEDLLTHIAGPTRVANLFCLRARDAEYLIDVLRRFAETRVFRADKEQLRYSSLNICALQKFNSLEFRALRGTVEPDEIQQWINFLLALKDAAKLYENPPEILGDISRLGDRNFVGKIFNLKQAQQLIGQKGFEERLWESTRLVQEVAFASDWLPLEPEPRERVFDVNKNVDPQPKPKLKGRNLRPEDLVRVADGWAIHDEAAAVPPNVRWERQPDGGLVGIIDMEARGDEPRR